MTEMLTVSAAASAVLSVRTIGGVVMVAVPLVSVTSVMPSGSS